MRNMKVWCKLTLGFGIVLLLMGVMAVFSVLSIKRGTELMKFVAGPQLDGFMSSNAVRSAGEHLILNAIVYRYTRNEDAWRDLEKSIEALKSEMKKSTNLLEREPELTVMKQYASPVVTNGLKYIDLQYKNHDLIAKEVEQKKTLVGVGASMTEDMESVAQAIGSDTNTTTAVQAKVVECNRILNKMRLFITNLSQAEYSEKDRTAVTDMLKNLITVTSQLSAMNIAPGATESLKSLIADISRYEKEFSALMDIRKQAVAAAEETLAERVEFMKGIEELDTHMSARIKEQTDQAYNNVVAVRTVILIGLLVAVFIGAFVAFMITRAITKPIKRIVAIAHRAGGGDLTVTRSDFEYEGSDELGTLVEAMNGMISEQAASVRQTMHISAQVGLGAEQLAALSQETNASMEEIRASIDQINHLGETNASSLEETNAGIEEMAAGAMSMAHSATESAKNVTNTNDAANEAMAMVKKVISHMGEVGRTSDANEEHIRKLAESVEKISGFVSVITSIADQTNLLALNAAIEAARAGEMGRGFAVVAEEVRKLAEESAGAAGKVSSLITLLQENAHAAIDGTVQSAHTVRSTLSQAAESQQKLEAVVESIKSVSDKVQSIAAIAQEQAASNKEMAEAVDSATMGTSEIVNRIERVNSATASASSASEGVAEAAQELNRHALSMADSLSRFKTNTLSLNDKNR